MTAKLCIHPSQIPIVHGVSAPDAAQINWAQRIVGSADRDGSVTSVDGQMVDLPVLQRARAILAIAKRSSLGG
jgi:citrate lyase beta subunit